MSNLKDNKTTEEFDELERRFLKPLKFINVPKYSKDFLKQARNVSEAIWKAFTTSKTDTLEELKNRKHISSEEYDQIIKLKTKRYINFNG